MRRVQSSCMIQWTYATEHPSFMCLAWSGFPEPAIGIFLLKINYTPWPCWIIKLKMESLTMPAQWEMVRDQVWPEISVVMMQAGIMNWDHHDNCACWLEGQKHPIGQVALNPVSKLQNITPVHSIMVIYSIVIVEKPLFAKAICNNDYLLRLLLAWYGIIVFTLVFCLLYLVA